MTFKEIVVNARKKSEVSAALALPWNKTNSRHGATRSKYDDHQSKCLCIMDAEESKGLRVEGIAPNS